MSAFSHFSWFNKYTANVAQRMVFDPNARTQRIRDAIQNNPEYHSKIVKEVAENIASKKVNKERKRGARRRVEESVREKGEKEAGEKLKAPSIDRSMAKKSFPENSS